MPKTTALIRVNGENELNIFRVEDTPFFPNWEGPHPRMGVGSPSRYIIGGGMTNGSSAEGDSRLVVLRPFSVVTKRAAAAKHKEITLFI